MVTNWAGNVTFAAERVVRPADVDELRRIVASYSNVHALGTGHSFSTVADTRGLLVSVDALPHEVEVVDDGAAVRVSAGTTFGELAIALDPHDLALANTGSLPHISVAGAASTGTHGSGDHNQCIAATVREAELVAASGDLVTVRRGDDDFEGTVLSLGALGVLTHLTLDTRPTFDVRQTVFDGVGWDVLLDRDGLDRVMASGYSVSVFTLYGDEVGDVWVKQRVGDPDDDLAWAGGRPVDGARHPIPGLKGETCTVQGGVPGRWHERLPHFRMEFTPSSGDELQTEYYVDREHGAAAVAAVRAVAEVVRPVLQVSELRTVAADDLWLSPTRGRDLLGLHFTFAPDAEGVARATAALEQALAPFDARPHWGKVFSLDPATVAALYPRLDDFRSLADRLDPDGVFTNDFVETYVRR